MNTTHDMENEELNLEGLLDEAIEGQIDTTILRPEDGDYQAYIEKFDSPRVVVAKTGKNTGKKFVVMDVHYRLTDWKVEGNDDLPSVKSGIMLDLDSRGKLDLGKGKNRQLGLIFEACGIADKNPTPRDCINVPITVRVKTKTKGENTNTNVVSWAKGE